MTEVLEEHNCFVDRIIDNVAYITLVDVKDNTVLWGEYPADELEALGIFERKRFICRVIETEDDLKLEMIPIPYRELTEADIKRIEESVKGIGEIEDDY